MEVDIAAEVPIRGVKRTAEPALSSQSKRARPSPPPSDEEFSSEAAEGISTPSTPASLPPSRQKRLVCTWSGCHKAFSRPIHLAEHLNSHKGVRTHACKQCDKKFFRASHLQHHVKNAHSAVREYVCDWEGCGKAFTTGTRLRRHVDAHTKRQEYRCDRPGCGQSFRKHATLQKHIKTTHEGQPAFVCDKPALGADGEECTPGEICGAGFPTQGKLRAHHGRVHGASRYWCTICTDVNGPLAFSTYTQFQAHNADVHPPTCSECPYTAASNRDLRQHLKQLHDISDANVAADAAAPPPATIRCERAGCDKTFSRRANLLTHIKSVHERRRFTCGEVPLADLNHVDGWDGHGACGKDFSAKGSLESHIRAAHLKQANPQRRKAKASTTKKPPAPQPPKKKPRVSAAARVAGTGYVEAARPLACFVTGCAFRFVRPYDRAVHARTKHGLGETDIAALAAASAAAAVASASATAVQSHSKNEDAAMHADSNAASADNEDEDEEAEVEEEAEGSEYAVSEPSEPDYEDELEQGAAAGGVFWLGGGRDTAAGANPIGRKGDAHGGGDDDDEDNTNEWDAWEAEEMYAVVHGGGDLVEGEEGGVEGDENMVEAAAEDEDGYEYDWTLEDDIPPETAEGGDYYDDDVTGTGGRVDMMLLG